MNVSNSMSYPLRFVYKRESEQIQDIHTHCAGSLLLLRNINTTQPSCDVLVFESERDREYALLALSNSPLYTLIVDSTT